MKIENTFIPVVKIDTKQVTEIYVKNRLLVIDKTLYLSDENKGLNIDFYA